MQLMSILNRKHSSFVYETVRLVEQAPVPLEVQVRPQAGARTKSDPCRRPAPGYDTQAARRFNFVPRGQSQIVFDYEMRRVSCSSSGVRVEAVQGATSWISVPSIYHKS